MRQLEELRRFFTPVPGMEVLVSFQGCFSQDLVVSLGELIREEIGRSYSPLMVNKVFGIYVEMAQNIMYYSLERKNGSPDLQPGKGNLILARLPQKLLLVTSNLVSTEGMSELTRRFKEINQMSQEEIKNIYLIKGRRLFGKDSAGAGLGLLEIARRSENPLSCGFLPEGKGKVRFFFRVLIAV